VALGDEAVVCFFAHAKRDAALQSEFHHSFDFRRFLCAISRIRSPRLKNRNIASIRQSKEILGRAKSPWGAFRFARTVAPKPTDFPNVI